MAPSRQRLSSRPAASASLQRLEREIGTTLIDRSSHPVSVTDAGLALLDEACNTLADADADAEAEAAADQSKSLGGMG